MKRIWIIAVSLAAVLIQTVGAQDPKTVVANASKPNTAKILALRVICCADAARSVRIHLRYRPRSRRGPGHCLCTTDVSSSRRRRHSRQFVPPTRTRGVPFRGVS